MDGKEQTAESIREAFNVLQTNLAMVTSKAQSLHNDLEKLQQAMNEMHINVDALKDSAPRKLLTKTPTSNIKTTTQSQIDALLASVKNPNGNDFNNRANERGIKRGELVTSREYGGYWRLPHRKKGRNIECVVVATTPKQVWLVELPLKDGKNPVPFLKGCYNVDRKC